MKKSYIIWAIVIIFLSGILLGGGATTAIALRSVNQMKKVIAEQGKTIEDLENSAGKFSMPNPVEQSRDEESEKVNVSIPFPIMYSGFLYMLQARKHYDFRFYDLEDYDKEWFLYTTQPRVSPMDTVSYLDR